jgi:hypothetical protein
MQLLRAVQRASALLSAILAMPTVIEMERTGVKRRFNPHRTAAAADRPAISRELPVHNAIPARVRLLAILYAETATDWDPTGVKRLLTLPSIAARAIRDALLSMPPQLRAAPAHVF